MLLSQKVPHIVSADGKQGHIRYRNGVVRDCKLIRGKWARPVLDAGKVAWMPLSMFDQVTGEKLYSVTID